MAAAREPASPQRRAAGWAAGRVGSDVPPGVPLQAHVLDDKRPFLRKNVGLRQRQQAWRSARRYVPQGGFVLSFEPLDAGPSRGAGLGELLASARPSPDRPSRRASVPPQIHNKLAPPQLGPSRSRGRFLQPHAGMRAACPAAAVGKLPGTGVMQRGWLSEKQTAGPALGAADAAAEPSAASGGDGAVGKASGGGLGQAGPGRTDAPGRAACQNAIDVSDMDEHGQDVRHEGKILAVSTANTHEYAALAPAASAAAEATTTCKSISLDGHPANDLLVVPSNGCISGNYSRAGAPAKPCAIASLAPAKEDPGEPLVSFSEAQILGGGPGGQDPAAVAAQQPVLHTDRAAATGPKSSASRMQICTAGGQGGSHQADWVELANQLQRLKDERTRVVRLREALGAGQAALNSDRAAFERQKEKAEETWAREQEADGKRLRRERRALEAQAKELLQLPTRRERSEADVLKAALATERAAARRHEVRARLTEHRLRASLAAAIARASEMQEELAWHEQQRMACQWTKGSEAHKDVKTATGAAKGLAGQGIPCARSNPGINTSPGRKWPNVEVIWGPIASSTIGKCMPGGGSSMENAPSLQTKCDLQIPFSGGSRADNGVSSQSSLLSLAGVGTGLGKGTQDACRVDVVLEQTDKMLVLEPKPGPALPSENAANVAASQAAEVKDNLAQPDKQTANLRLAPTTSRKVHCSPAPDASGLVCSSPRGETSTAPPLHANNTMFDAPARAVPGCLHLDTRKDANKGKAQQIQHAHQVSRAAEYQPSVMDMLPLEDRAALPTLCSLRPPSLLSGSKLDGKAKYPAQPPGPLPVRMTGQHIVTYHENCGSGPQCSLPFPTPPIFIISDASIAICQPSSPRTFCTHSREADSSLVVRSALDLALPQYQLERSGCSGDLPLPCVVPAAAQPAAGSISQSGGMLWLAQSASAMPAMPVTIAHILDTPHPALQGFAGGFVDQTALSKEVIQEVSSFGALPFNPSQDDLPSLTTTSLSSSPLHTASIGESLSAHGGRYPEGENHTVLHPTASSVQAILHTCNTALHNKKAMASGPCPVPEPPLPPPSWIWVGRTQATMQRTPLDEAPVQLAPRQHLQGLDTVLKRPALPPLPARLMVSTLCLQPPSQQFGPVMAAQEDFQSAVRPSQALHSPSTCLQPLAVTMTAEEVLWQTGTSATTLGAWQTSKLQNKSGNAPKRRAWSFDGTKTHRKPHGRALQRGTLPLPHQVQGRSHRRTSDPGQAPVQCRGS